MPNRKGAVNSEATNENSRKSNRRNYQCIENSDSSDEYEEETHISYQFRRWANHIRSVSSNVTSRLRDLLGNHPSSDTTSNQSVEEEENCQDESNATSRTSSSDVIESSNRINNGNCNTTHLDHQHTQNYHKSIPQQNHCRYGQRFSRMAEDRRTLKYVTANRLETRPNFVTTYPPVLILPRLYQGVNRQPMDTGSYQSARKRVLRRQNMHDDEERAYGWHRRYHHLENRWGCAGGPRSGDNYSSLSDRREIPEEFSSLINDPKIDGSERKPTWVSRGKEKIEPGDYGLKSMKHYRPHVSDFHSERCRNGKELYSAIHGTRRSGEQTLARSWTPRNYGDNDTRQNSKAKKTVRDSRRSDITSQETRSAKQSILSLDIEDKKTFVDRNRKSTLASHEIVEVPVKDDAKQQQFVDAVEHSRISHDVQAGEKSCEKQNDDLVNGKGTKWSLVVENSVDLLLQSVRERMNTLANVHSLDIGATSGSIGCNRREEAALARKCIVASCLAGTYLPQCLERHYAADSLLTKGEIRPSFSDRIQDIWRDGRATVWRSSPRGRISPLVDNPKTGEDLPSKLSLLGLNQLPVLREYLGGYDNAATLARILEKLIDYKSRTDTTSLLVSQAPKPPPRVSRKQSKICRQVNVGIQKSTPMSTASCQDQVSYSTHCLIKRHKARRSFRWNSRPRGSEIPIGTPRPLLIFSGQSIIPISSIQFTPGIEPLSNSYGSSPPQLDTTASTNRYGYPSGNRAGHSIIIDNPVLEEEISRQVTNDEERILSLVLEKMEQKQQRAQRISQNTDLSQQHQPQNSTPVVRLQESRVAEGRSCMSTKGCSWWKKKFHSDKRSTLKGKLTSLLKRVTKKHTNDGINYQSQTCASEKGRNENVVPIPPARMRRKSNARCNKSSKSIQWEFDEDVSHSIEKIDSFQLTESQQSNKSTSMGLSIRKATVTNGTNTSMNKSKLSLVNPAIIQVAKQVPTDLPNKLLASDRTSMKSADIAANAEKISELSSADNKPSCNQVSLPSEENLESPIYPCKKYERDSSGSEKSKVSRSSSSKIPLAIKPVGLFNASLTISGRRPSTAPILEGLSSHLLRSDACLGEFEGRKPSGKECVSQELAAKKMLYKHNRSSLLRANNSMSRKSTMGKSYLSNYVVKKSIPKALTSSFPMNEGEILSEKLILEEQLDGNKSDTIKTAESLPLEDGEVKEFLETHPTSAMSEYWTKETVAGKISSCDLSGVFLLKRKDLTYNKDILDFLHPEHSSNNEGRNPLGEGQSIVEETEAAIVNFESQKLDENIISDSAHLREEDECRKTHSTLCDRVSNAKSEEDEKLPTKLEVSKDIIPKLVDSQELKEFESNVSELQSDVKSVFTENSAVEEKQEGFVACRVETDEMMSTLNEETRLQLRLPYSTANKTEEYLFKLALPNKDVRTAERSRRLGLQSKSNPSPKLSSRNGIGKNNGKLRKNIILHSTAVPRFNSQSVNNESVEKLENKTANTVSRRMTKGNKNTKQKLTKICKTRNENYEEIFKVVRKMVDAVINESINTDQRTNLGMVSAEQNTPQSIPSNLEKLPELSINSLETIRVQATLITPSSIGKKICSSTRDEVDEKYSPCRSPNQEKIFGSSFSRKESDICVRRAQLHLSPVKKPKMISEIITEERLDGCQGIQSSKKFLITSKSSPRNQTGEILTPLDARSAKNPTKESKLVVERLQKPCNDSDKTNCRDSEFEVTVMPAKMVTDKNRKEGILFVTEYWLTQSVITFDLAEVVDKPEKLLSSMFNVHVESSVELEKSELQASASDEVLENRKLLDIDSNSRVMNCENRGKSSKGGRNVKINNKVLEEKVKCSIENGVPLKIITITDPSIIKYNCLNNTNPIADRIMRDEDMKKTGSEISDILPKILHNNSQKVLLDAKTEGQCSHSIKAGHEIPSKLENVELYTPEDLAQVIADNTTCAVGQNNLISSTTRLKSNTKSRRRQSTLIPRYKKIL